MLRISDWTAGVQRVHPSEGEAKGATGLRRGPGPSAHSHDGAHSAAVALPHAAEAGLSPDVPELQRGRGVSGGRLPPPAATPPPRPRLSSVH